MAYFNIGDVVYYGKYKNKKGIIRDFDTDKWGNPTIEVEPSPKGRKKNKIMSLFKIWRADIKDRVLEEKKRVKEQLGINSETSLESKTAQDDSVGYDYDYRNVFAAKYKQKIKTEAGNTVYTYSERQVSNRNRDKAERVEKLRKSLSKLKTRIKSDMNSGDKKKAMIALAVALIDHTYERVGNDTSVEERGHFGVTGWQKKHINFDGGNCVLSYTGKSGVKHKKKITDANLKTKLKKLYDSLENEDTTLLKYGKDSYVTADDVNSYLDEMGLGITAKDIRGLHANKEMQKHLKQIRSEGGDLPTSRKEKDVILKKEFLKALELTAKAVGHEAATLRKQYLVPGLEDTFLKDGTVMDKLSELEGYRNA